jgi:hypothetical protein
MAARYDHWLDDKVDPPAGGAYFGTIDSTSRSPSNEVTAGTSPNRDRADEAARLANFAWSLG